MVRKLRGRILEKDKFNRIKCQFPHIYTDDHSDQLNTKAQLDAFDKTMAGVGDQYWSPNFKTMFLAKLTEKSFCYDQFGDRMLYFDNIVSQYAELEVEFLPFKNSAEFLDIGESPRDGWFIRVLSIQLL